MERISIKHCRELIGQAEADALADEDVIRLRDVLYALGEVIADTFADLNNIDQSTLQPTNDLDDWLGDAS